MFFVGFVKMLDHYLLHMTSDNNVKILLADNLDNYLLIVVVIAHLVETFRSILGISFIRLAIVFILMDRGSFIIIRRFFIFVFTYSITPFFTSFTSYLYCFNLIYYWSLLLKHLSPLLEVTPLAHIFIATTHKTT